MTWQSTGVSRARGFAFGIVALCAACVPVPGVTGDPREATVSSGSAMTQQTPRRSRGVDGRVLNANGTPVAGVMVQAASDGAQSGPIPELAIMTNRDGVFHWPLRPGRYVLSAAVPGQGTVRLQVTVPEGSAVSVVMRPG